MQSSDLEKYCAKALQSSITGAKIINPKSVVTVPWVRMKRLFGCPGRHGYDCPPNTPSPTETRTLLELIQQSHSVSY